MLVNGRYVSDPDEKDYYRVFTLNDDGTDICEIYAGIIPQKPTANGIRWMCFADNRRILLGDYVIECEPDLDHCEKAELIELIYPEEIKKQEGVFAHWSEIIISPDCAHMCWTLLRMMVHGEHNGEMELRAVFDRPTSASPSMLIFDTGEDGAPQSRGYATYDGQTLRIEDMEP